MGVLQLSAPVSTHPPPRDSTLQKPRALGPLAVKGTAFVKQKVTFLQLGAFQGLIQPGSPSEPWGSPEWELRGRTCWSNSEVPVCAALNTSGDGWVGDRQRRESWETEGSVGDQVVAVGGREPRLSDYTKDWSPMSVQQEVVGDCLR